MVNAPLKKYGTVNEENEMVILMTEVQENSHDL